MQEYVSPRLAAAALGVSESSLKRWADRGLVPLVKTAGGHRRVLVAGLVQFAREHGHAIQNPQMLGLPPGEERGTPTLELAVDDLAAHLLSGDEEWVRRAILGAYLAGGSPASLLDQGVAPAFHKIGSLWQHGEADIFEEHRATEIMLRVLYELRLLLARPSAGAPLALGATLPGDNYSLPLLSAELVLLEAGFATMSLGHNLEETSFVRALERTRPRLCFISISHVDHEEAFLRQYELVRVAATSVGAFVVVGGRALTAELSKKLRFGAACENLTRLRDLAHGLASSERMQ